MSKFIEIKENNDLNMVIDLEKVISFYIHTKEISNGPTLGKHRIGEYNVTKKYFIVFIMDYDKKYFHNCNSELEAQMIYAKLKKKLCTDEELNEIL